MRTTTEREYGQFQDDTSWYKHAHRADAGELSYLALGLSGETGEFADAVKKIVRECGQDDPNHFWQVLNREGVREKLIDELGDTLWYLNKLMRFLNVSHEELMVRNTYKLYSRLMERPKANLMELEWPFSTPELSFAVTQERHTLLMDKDKDGV